MQNKNNPGRGRPGARRPYVARISLAAVHATARFKRLVSPHRARRIGAAALVALAGSAAVAAYAVFSSVPGRIQVAPVSVVVHSAATLPAEVRALEAGTAPLLFDRDTRTAHVAFADQHIDATLDRPTEIRAIKVYGPAPYELTVSALQDGAWTPIPGLSGLRLGGLDPRWTEFAATQPVTAQTLRFELTLVPGAKGKAAATGLAELEIWGTGDHALVSGAALVGAMQTVDAAGGQPAQARAYAATPESGVVGQDGQTFRFTLDRPAARFKRAWLSYEAYGLAHWVSPVRRINGLAVQGGNFTFSASEWTPLVEPIHPDWLVEGGNRIAFALPPDAGGTYSVRNVRIVGELDDGANFIARATTTVAGIENDTPALVDGDFASEWSPYADPRSKTGKPELTLYFDRPTQLDVVSMHLANALAGTLSVDLRVDGQWQSAGLPTINGAKLSAGWNALSGFAPVAADALRIVFLNGHGSSGEIREIAATGSGVGGPHTPDIVVTYPDAGQFYGRQAYLRGFLGVPDNGSGPAVVSIGERIIPVSDGSFGVVVSKDEVGYANQADGEPWQVQIDAVYPDGQKLARIVRLTRPYDAARAQGVLPGVVNPGFSAVVVVGEASLDIDPGAVDKPVDIRITPLKEHELPPLDPGMTNVTSGPFRGYRFTPHGAKFRKHIKVTLPYDPALIPQGLNEQDIKTYYFDTELNRWMVLDRYRVDNGKRKVTSLTNHFTDMINATLTVPDHPETTSYNATQMKDIKAADPGAGINLIEPPQANNMGDARLSYPIEIPPGRLGMQPQLGIHYSSSGGNGWMGIGWDLSVPSITIDTRWGVPRYSETQETETYLLNGEMLTPVAHRGEMKPRSAEKVFLTRVEGQFRKIVRHGDHPNNYWWEVTDKNGTRFLYGADPVTRQRNEASTLADGKGNGFLWVLREMRDTHDNFVRYHYTRVEDTGVVGGSVPGFNLYLKKITYTGHGTEEGAYAVTFERDRELGEPLRGDRQIDARGGFKRVTADLLRKAVVSFEGRAVRAYAFEYAEGAFHKTLLQRVVQYDGAGREFNRHAFAYYDEARDDGGRYKGFAAPFAWATGDDAVGADLLGAVEASALGGTRGRSAGGHLYVGIGPFDGKLMLKSNTNGGKIGFNRSSSETLLTLADMDGDGLPDKVFKDEKGAPTDGSVFYYRPNLARPGGTAGFGAPVRLRGVASIGRENVTSTTAGAEFFLKAEILADVNSAVTRADVYFSDVNGDGLTDLVSGGHVLFGYLNAEKAPTFDADSGATPVPIGGGTVDTTQLLEDADAVEAERAAAYPLLDSLRRWVAPYDGVVAVNGAAALIEDASPARSDYAGADGVRLAIQLENAELWSRRIAATDYTPHVPEGVDAIRVRKGDRLYFRVQSVFDGAYDQVAWDPQITYVGVDASRTDVNGLAEYRYQALRDFVLAGRRGTVTAPLTGVLHLGGTLEKSGATTDDVTLLITKNGAEIHRETLGFAETRTVTLSKDVAVAQLDTLEWRILVDSPIDAGRIRFAPTAHYAAAEGVDAVEDASGRPVIQVNPPFDMDVYPVSNLAAPQAPYVASRTGSLPVKARFVLGGLRAGETAEAVLTVKRPGALLAKHPITITGTGAPVETEVTLSVPVTAGDALYFDLSSRRPSFLANLAELSVTTGGTLETTLPVAVHVPAAEALFPQPYRGWAAAGYNGNDERAERPIDQALLVLNETADPATATAYPYVPQHSGQSWSDPALPRPAGERWGGVDELAWVGPGAISASRLGLDDIRAPRAGEFAGASAVARISRSFNASLSVGGSLPVGDISVNGSVSASFGDSRSVLDFQDMNGDRFPDVLGHGGIQYTRMSGGLDARAGELPDGSARKSDNLSVNLGAGGTIPVAIGNARGNVPPSGQTTAPSASQGTDMPSLGVGGNLGGGSSDARHDLIDINGDGLPDRVYQDGTARLNLGYAFAESAEPWSGGIINDGETLNTGVNMGFNVKSYSIGGGLNLATGRSRTDETYADVNGDGLPDKVIADKAVAGNPLRVRLNTGAGFAAETDWPGGHGKVAEDKHITLGGGAYFTYCIPLPPVDPVQKLCFNPGVNFSTSMGRPEFAFRDIDGDGYADHLYSDKDSELRVAPNPIGRTNLLKSVARPLGARIDIEYARDGNTYEQPQSRWVMKKVAVNDGHPGDGVDTLVSTYRYKKGYYDRLERDFYGYGTVVQEQRDAGVVYRAVTQDFHTDSYYTKGLVKRELTTDGAGRPYLATENRYALMPVAGGAADPASTHAALFPALVRTERSFHEGGQGTKRTHTTFEYDAWGNVTRFTDAGDEGSDDDVEALINYSVGCTDRHIVGKPLDITVIAAGGVMRSREGDIDCATGNLTQLRQAIGQGEVAQTDLAYYPDGNLRRVTGPANLKGQRYALDYAYDPAVATHVVETHDSFGYRSTATYDYRFGKPLSTTDLNGNVISTAYDSFGRTVAIHGPYEQGSANATLRFAYFPDAATPYAITEHLNLDAAGQVKAPIDTVLFTDGIKRVLQTKKRAAVNGQTMMIVSGRTVFDGLGRTVAQYYPVVEPLGQAGTFNGANDERYHTATEFDVLDRTVKTTLPDATVTTMSYGFGSDRDGRNQFRTVVTDANGNSKESYRDVRELITAVKETNKGEALWTSYAYDPLKQIVQVKDVKGVLTKVEYDMLGRRTVIDNPDTGRTVTVYDPASNVVKKITANLAAAKKAIAYDYDYNRLAAIHYPINAANDVSYEYGAADRLGNGSNQVGRLVKVMDASGSQELHYGKLGETVKEIRTIASHTQGASKNSPEVYTTRYRYDSFGRLLELVLPDSETVTHVYDAGGSLQSFAGEKSGVRTAYLNLVHYDKFEQRTRLVLGNGIETNYAYDPASRRLDTLTSAGTRAGTFQNLHYGYDRVGNILSLANQVDVPPPTTFGGPNKQSFGYDDLYRLTEAKGEYKSAPDRTRNYTLDLTYDTNHNILAKKQSDVVTNAGGSAIEQKGTSYDWHYDYAGRQPHAPTHIGNRSFTYDLNGNQTGWESDVNGTRRHILWDEENRIAEIDDNGERNRYVYDAKGERTIKETKQGETVYVNQYYVVRNRSVVSKHLYAGSGRIVTHLVMGTAPGNEQRGAPGNGHGSDKVRTKPETGNDNSGQDKEKGNNGQAGNDKEQTNNGLHLGQLKNGRENPGQGRDRRSETANLHAQDVVKNPTLTGEHPGQGSGSARRAIDSDAPVVITEGEASVEINGDTSAGEVAVDGVTESFPTPTVNGQSEFIWYYHPDHLGSTGFVTDQNGELYEHVEYFPFGETWVQEHSNTQRTPYLYTGKELDEETGLYYYGARYYDPRTGVWQSVDPILGQVLSERNGTERLSWKLALFTYGRLNPLSYLDPDGRDDYVFYYAKAADKAFERAANTYATEAGQTAHLIPVTTETEFKESWSRLSASGAPVDSVVLLVHGGKTEGSEGELYFTRDGQNNGTLNAEEIQDLPRLNYTNEGQIDIRACRSGLGELSVGSNMAQSQRVKTKSMAGYAYFSESPSEYKETNANSSTMHLKAYERRSNVRTFSIGSGNEMAPVVNTPQKKQP